MAVASGINVCVCGVGGGGGGGAATSLSQWKMFLTDFFNGG